jgi:GT2 family glycosyltransferase
VIGAWNSAEVLEPCIESIARQRLPQPAEVIVVDDGSTDATPRLLAARSELIVLRNDSPAGYCAAINRGAQRASGDVLLLCNSDVEFLRPDAIAQLIAGLERDGIGIAVPRYTLPDGRLQPCCARFPSVAGAALLASGLHHLLPDRQRARWAPEHWSHSQSRDVDWAMGAVVAIRRSLFAELGGYWPLVFGSETDLAWRLRARGAGARFVRESEVMHVGDFSNRRRWSRPRRAARVANAELVFLRRHYGRARRVGIRLVRLAGAIVRIPFLIALGRRRRAADYAAMAAVYAGGPRASLTG